MAPGRPGPIHVGTESIHDNKIPGWNSQNHWHLPDALLLDGGTTQADVGPWRSQISGWQEVFPLTYDAAEPGGPLKPQYCLERLRDSAAPGTIVASGVCSRTSVTARVGNG